MPVPMVGILGMGYLGKQLLKQLPDEQVSWVTLQQQTLDTTCVKKNNHSVIFQWESPATWSNLPDAPASLVLTIPPVLKEVQAEIKRLSHWGQWMNRERPQIKKLIYISSTGVYPSENGTWKETDIFQPDHAAGKLRLETEKVLNHYFQTYVIRPGGIYGPGRHIGQRVLNQKPIPAGERPVHRIHVVDLANIVQYLIENDNPPPCVNAVDQNPAPSSKVVAWLIQSNLLKLPSDISVAYQDKAVASNSVRYQTKEHRFISNQRLLQEMKYHLQFPTYREGFAAIFDNVDT